MDSEVNNGRGPVDFKASNSRKDATLIEFKLTRTLKKNLEKQVEVYKDANRTDKAIKVILFFTDEEYKKTIDILNELELIDKPGIVVLCILSVIPLIIVGVMEAPDYICGISVGMLLIIIAVGVNLLIRTGMIKGSYDTLLQEGEFTKEQKQLKKKKIHFLAYTGV